MKDMFDFLCQLACAALVLLLGISVLVFFIVPLIKAFSPWVTG